MKRNLSLMIKPSSSKCNLKCKYCFYHSISDARDIKDYGLMPLSTLKEIVKNASDYCDGGHCSIGFQGGESTIIGLDFYKELIEYIKTIKNGTSFSFAIQTNGTLLNEDWGKFLHEHDFLVGISLDGNKEIHNLNRVDYKSDDTFNSVIRGINILKKYVVSFNILTVVTSALCNKVEGVYNFYKKNGYKYLQFNPCLEPLENTTMALDSYSLTPKEYEKFLIKLFDLWYKDALNNSYVSIRLFDNILGLFLKQEYEACDMRGVCSCQHIIESDGSVYPCDFYTYESCSIGNILENSFDDIHNNKNTINFLQESTNRNPKCNSCKYFSLCRGGCRRHRENQENNLNYFCESYYNFYSYSLDKFKNLALTIQNSSFRRQKNC